MKLKFLSLKLIILLGLSFQAFPQTNLVSAPPATVNVSFDRLQRIDAVIQQSLDKKEIAGAVALLARNGKIVYSKAFGYSDIESKAPLRTDNIFRIASQTKAITSVAVMMLFEEGKLLLDDPISKYIPSFSKPLVLDKFNPADSSYTTVPAKREVTIRDLLTHTSGIDYAVIGTAPFKAIYAKEGIPVGFEGGKVTLKEAVERLGKMPLGHQPGERFTYGLNTDVLGYLVEVLSGKSLDKFFEERIFQPLGMKDTYFVLPTNKHSRLTPIYTFDTNNNLVKYERNGVITADYPTRKTSYFSGGAGLSSTITDYATFLQMLLNGGVYNGKRLLGRRTVELMTSNQIGELNVRTDKFGLGFQITSELGQAKLGVSKGSFGWGGYFGTTYWADPKEKIVGLIFIQQSPLKSDIHDKFRAAVYQSLND
ncbi:serine hydrolase domain-containing protein [Desertivirga arenae]|uniref:serine hydrolase domain-containing protein n=1 Tax=Desertivirga arenae TaxID=2810309 RepID=UPI001A96CB36|nr:serine hydrolase domain-containing protein [Pedobacter sp. SYSU D00823]